MAETVAEYLNALPPDRAAQLKKVRSAIRRALPNGYEEAISGSPITYKVSLATYPDTVLLERLQDGFRVAGKRLDIGKACIHFTKADDLALECISEIVAGMPVAKWVEIARSARKPKAQVGSTPIPGVVTRAQRVL